MARQIRRHAVSGAKRLRNLEIGNNRLRKLLTRAYPDMHALKDMLGIKRQLHTNEAPSDGSIAEHKGE